QALAVLLLIFFALAVAWPFFRFPFMGITERIPRRAGLYYLLSMFAAPALLVLLALHVRYYTQGTGPDPELRPPALTMENKLAQEVRTALQVLHALTESAPFTTENTRLAKTPTCVADPDFVNEEIPHRMTGLLARPSLPMAQYPYFDNVFWADANGFQRAKWSVHSELTPPTRVCRFEFFQETLADHLWYFAENGPGGARFRIDPLYSPNTAEYLAPISLSAKQWENTGTGIRTAHLVTPLLTLIAPVLPPGYGFAIVDSTGHVLFHSDPAKNSSENFFGECQGSGPLRRAVASRMAASFNIDYLGRPYRVLVSPFQRFQHSNWT